MTKRPADGLTAPEMNLASPQPADLPVDGRSTLLRAVFRAYERVIEQQQLVVLHESDLRKRLYQYFTWDEGLREGKGPGGVAPAGAWPAAQWRIGDTDDSTSANQSSMS